MSLVISKLTEDHRNMVLLMRLIGREVDALENGERWDHRLVEFILDYTQHHPDCRHHPLEDEIREKLARRAPEAARAAGNVLAEHAELIDLAHRLDDAVKNVRTRKGPTPEEVAAVARAYRERLLAHIDAEETLLFPLALENLSAADWQEIEDKLGSDIDPVFGRGSKEQKYEKLRKAITSWEDEDALIAADRDGVD